MCDVGGASSSDRANGAFNAACDALCYFQAPQVVRVHDRKFGAMHRVLQFFLVGFIIYHIVWLMDFRETTLPYGAISVSPQFASFGGNHTPDYCIPGTADNMALEYRASNFASERDVANITCRQFSSHEVVDSNELYTSITTRIVETHTWRSNCSEYGTQCQEVDKFKDVFVPGVEEGVFEVEHEVTNPKFSGGGQAYSKGSKSHRMKREQQHIMVETDLYYEHPKTHEKYFLRHYKHNQPVQISIKELFNAVHESDASEVHSSLESLNPNANPDRVTGEQPQFRTTGAEFILDFEYSNKWHPSLFDETVVCRAYIKHVPMQLVELGEEVHYVNYPDEVYTWERFGVLVSFHEVAVRGDIAFFSWNALIYSLVNYFVLFAVVTLVVQTFVFFVNPCKGKKELYALARRRDCHTPNDYKADMELVHKDTGFSDYLKDNFTTQEFERKRRASLNVKSADALHDEMSMEEAEQNGTGGAGPHTSSRLDDTNDSRMLVVTDEPSETKLGDVSEAERRPTIDGAPFGMDRNVRAASPTSV